MHLDVAAITPISLLVSIMATVMGLAVSYITWRTLTSPIDQAAALKATTAVAEALKVADEVNRQMLDEAHDKLAGLGVENERLRAELEGLRHVVENHTTDH